MLSSWGSKATPDKNPEKGDDRESANSPQGSNTGGRDLRHGGANWLVDVEDEQEGDLASTEARD